MLTRRKFLRQTSFTIPAFALLPGIFSSCKRDSLVENLNFDGKVIIVGAGAAGLYAAYLLHQQGVDVQILEASNGIGGRIKRLEGFGDFTIELGAEEVHGQNSLWHDMVVASGAQFVTAETNDLFRINGVLQTEASALNNAFFSDMTDLVDSIEAYDGGDVTAEQWGGVNGVHSSVEHIFNAWVGNEYGTSNSRLGMYGLRESEERWTAGDENFLLKDKDFLYIMEERFSGVLDQVELNTQIISINYEDQKILLTSESGIEYEADKIIVTVPITILKEGDINFVPALPSNKIEAFQKIGMDTGMKIILKFDERVWPVNTGSIYSDGHVPEFWATGAGGRGTDNILTAFVNGENAEYLLGLGDGMIDVILAELDAILGDASSHYVDHVIQDWGAEPFVRGAYSYPKVGSLGAFEIIAQPVDGKIFFAGEATHFGGHFGTVHGAMESGLRAVKELLT
ncbi:MAG: NAD(P)/FAD-dependent oxidoreductase [Flavobacteriales bacterium]|nr:NAD(P)/FAD-dependent oxidoreductase [Flavobacteriales bacterium]